MEKRDTPKMVVEKLLELTKENLLPWQCPWMVRQPKNPLSGTRYRGINWLLLTLKLEQYDGENRFVTFKQVQDYAKKNKKAMFVRKGEKSSMIVKYGVFEKEVQNANGDTEEKRIPFLQAWNVFNVKQIEGWDIPNPETFGTTALPDAQTLINKVGIKVVTSNEAAYSPSLDCLYMPPADTFATAEKHIQVLGHELIHATGHKSRLNRKSMEEGIRQKYATEELVAEIGTAMLMAELGISVDYAQSAEYIRGWWSVIKKNPKNFIWAVSQAQKAVEYILGTTLEEVQVTEAQVAGTNEESYGYVG